MSQAGHIDGCVMRVYPPRATTAYNNLNKSKGRYPTIGNVDMGPSTQHSNTPYNMCQNAALSSVDAHDPGLVAGVALVLGAFIGALNDAGS